MDKRIKNKLFKAAIVLVLVLVCVYEPGLIANASEAGANAEGVNAVTSKMETLLSIVTAFISGLGSIITLWGISEWGMAFQGNDGTMQTHALKRIGGGLIMIIAPQLLSLFT